MASRAIPAPPPHRSSRPGGRTPVGAAAPGDRGGPTRPAPIVFAKGLEAVNGMQSQADALAGQVATGSIQDIHQFTAAAAKAQLGVELTVALRNSAVDAYQDIMRMQV